MKTVLIISYSSLDRDPRILRQIQALQDTYKLCTIGDTPTGNTTITHYSTYKKNKRTIFQKILNRLKRYFLLFKTFFENHDKYLSLRTAIKLNFEHIFSHQIKIPDVIIANDWNGLYLASQLKSRYQWQAKIYFDAHEYAPKEFDASLKWRLFEQPIIIYALKKCKDDIAVMSTVCDGIAREYEQFFNFNTGTVSIITNASAYQNSLKPKELRDNKIRLIHHGGAIKTRHLELMIKMMKYLDSEKYELTFMLVQSNKAYYDYLIKLSARFTNIHFIESVSFAEISKKINNYDIGVFLLPSKNFNDKYALPNKLFEFIQARLAVAIGPSIEMVKILDHYNLGVHSEDFIPKSLAQSIATMTLEKIMEYKKNADTFAKKLSAEENMQKIKTMISNLAGI